MFIHCLYCLYCMGMFLMSCIKIHIFIISQPYMATKTAPSCSAWLPEVQHHSRQPVFCAKPTPIMRWLSFSIWEQQFIHRGFLKTNLQPCYVHRSSSSCQRRDLSLADTTRTERQCSHFLHCSAIRAWVGGQTCSWPPIALPSLAQMQSAGREFLWT